jgi:hypothetical protein
MKNIRDTKVTRVFGSNNYISRAGALDCARAYFLCMLDRHPPAAGARPIGRSLRCLLRFFFCRAVCLPTSYVRKHRALPETAAYESTTLRAPTQRRGDRGHVPPFLRPFRAFTWRLRHAQCSRGGTTAAQGCAGVSYRLGTPWPAHARTASAGPALGVCRAG